MTSEQAQPAQRPVWARPRTWVLIGIAVVVAFVAWFLVTGTMEIQRSNKVGRCIEAHRSAGDTRQDIDIRYECSNRVDRGYEDDDPHVKW